jgi:hypothetical protein
MNSEFNSGETLQAILSGNFQSTIEDENIKFFRGHVNVPIEFGVAKINDDYHIYGILPEVNGDKNYSLRIIDVEYSQGTSISDEDIVIPFLIKKELAEFNINPGFVVDNKDFSIKIQNLQETKISISINTEESPIIPSQSELELKSGEIKNLNFQIDDSSSDSFSSITISGASKIYSIPISIFIKQTPPPSEFASFTFSPREIKSSFVRGEEKTKTIKLLNDGEKIIENISLHLSDSLIDYILLTEYEIDSLSPDDEEEIGLLIRSDISQDLQGSITAESQSGDITDHFDIDIEVVDDISHLPPVIVDPDPKVDNKLDDYDPTQDRLTCSELSGEFCQSEENCKDNDVEELFAGDCCISECIPKKSPGGSSQKIVGYSIVGVVILILIYMYFKYRGTKKPFSLRKVVKERSGKNI